MNNQIKKLTIVFFTETYTPQINGVVTSTKTFSEELKKLGHRVIIVCPKTDKTQHSTESEWRFKSVAYPFQPEHRIISPLSRKLKQFKNLKPDIIHIQTPFFMGHLGQFLSWKHDIPLVHTYHTYWMEYLYYFPLLPKKFRRNADDLFFTKNFCNRCDHVVVPSGQIETYLNKKEVSPPISVIPTGIKLNNDNISKKEIETFKEKYKFKKDYKTLIFVGRIGREKNIYFLIDCLAKIIKKNPKTQLFIAGDGPEKKQLLNNAII